MDNETYKSIVEQTADAIVLADKGGVIQVWNRGAEALFGYTAQEAVGQTLDIIIPEQNREKHWTGYDRALAAKKSQYERQTLFTKASNKTGGPIYVELGLTILLDAAGEPLGSVAVIRDAAPHRERERALRNKISELEKKVKESQPQRSLSA